MFGFKPINKTPTLLCTHITIVTPDFPTYEAANGALLLHPHKCRTRYNQQLSCYNSDRLQFGPRCCCRMWPVEGPPVHQVALQSGGRSPISSRNVVFLSSETKRRDMKITSIWNVETRTCGLHSAFYGSREEVFEDERRLLLFHLWCFLALARVLTC